MKKGKNKPGLYISEARGLTKLLRIMITVYPPKLFLWLFIHLDISLYNLYLK